VTEQDQAIFKLVTTEKPTASTRAKSVLPEIKIKTATYIEDNDEEENLTKFIQEKKDKLRALMSKPLDLNFNKDSQIAANNNYNTSNISNESPMTLAGETNSIMPQIMIEENLSTGSKALA